MNESDIKALLDTAWHRPLTDVEEASIRGWCRVHPDVRASIESDLELARAIHQLPNLPVPSNFMSQIWEEVDRSERAEQRVRTEVRTGSGWSLWLPRFAVASLVVGMMTLGWRQHRSTQRAEIAAGLEMVSNTADVPDLKMLGEFEAIKLMSEAASSVDIDLLSALQ